MHLKTMRANSSSRRNLAYDDKNSTHLMENSTSRNIVYSGCETMEHLVIYMTISIGSLLCLAPPSPAPFLHTHHTPQALLATYQLTPAPRDELVTRRATHSSQATPTQRAFTRRRRTQAPTADEGHGNGQIDTGHPMVSDKRHRNGNVCAQPPQHKVSSPVLLIQGTIKQLVKTIVQLDLA